MTDRKELILRLRGVAALIALPPTVFNDLRNAADMIEADGKRIAELGESNKDLTDAILLRGQRMNEQRKRIEAAAEAVREAAAKVCTDKEDWYDKKEGHKWPEQQTNAMNGCGECGTAIRALNLADIIQKVTK